MGGTQETVSCGLTRRDLLGAGAARAAATPAEPPFDSGAFGTVGVFGLDWLLDPRFTRLLDTLAASPGAVRGLRVFGALSLGRDKVFPTASAGVWDSPAGPPDFGRTLLALDALVRRGLVPFLPLTFFPPAVSATPTQPPADWTRWTALVRAFLDAAAARFGAAEVSRWWFEAWNEPNMPPFWAGSFDQYLDLYRATSAAAAGRRIRLGGPALAYLPGEGPALMERFLRFLADEPGVQCDFISLHRKGSWTNGEGEPDLQRLVQAADETARAILRIVPGRARGMVVVNNEADMKVGFDRPYPPRMTHRSTAWLAASLVAHDALDRAWAPHGIRFRAFSDNANQQLAQGPFDGRRMLMTPVSDAADALVKLPVFAFYELLRLMGPRRLPVPPVPPGVSALVTAGPDGMAALFTRYGECEAAFDWMPSGLPWRRVNVVQFRVDAGHTNPAPGMAPLALRRAAELGVAAPVRCGVAPGAERVTLGPYATALVWITPVRAGLPAAPRWIEVRREVAGTLLRWTPSTDPAFYGYEAARDGAVITPDPMRAAIWVDAEGSGTARYAVRTVTASGGHSAWAAWDG